MSSLVGGEDEGLRFKVVTFLPTQRSGDQSGDRQDQICSEAAMRDKIRAGLDYSVY